MNTLNLYAPPLANLDTLPADCHYWRKGRNIILRRSHELPGRCVKCNAPASTPVKTHRLQWRHPIYGLFNRHAHVGIPLCTHHERHFRIRRRISHAFMVGALLGLCACVWAPRHATDVLPALLTTLFCAALAAILHSSAVPLKARRIDKEFIHLRGGSEAFLAALPEYPLR